MAYNNDNQGAIFKNDKGDNPRRPDSRGRCVIDGKAYRISGWNRKAKSGVPYLSLAFTRSEEDDPQPNEQQAVVDTTAEEVTAEGEPVTAEAVF